MGVSQDKINTITISENKISKARLIEASRGFDKGFVLKGTMGI